MGRKIKGQSSFKEEQLYLDLSVQIQQNTRIRKLDHLVVDGSDGKSVELAAFLSSKLNLPVLVLVPREEGLYTILDDKYTAVTSVLIVRYRYEEDFFAKTKAFMQATYGPELFVVGACIHTSEITSSRVLRCYVFFVSFTPQFLEDLYIEGFSVEGKYKPMPSGRYLSSTSHPLITKEMLDCFLLSGVVLDFHGPLHTVQALPEEQLQNFYVSKYVDKTTDVHLVANNHHSYYLGAFTCLYADNQARICIPDNYYKYLLANLRPLLVIVKNKLYLGISSDLMPLATNKGISLLVEMDYSRCSLVYDASLVESLQVPNLRSSFVETYARVYGQ